MLGGLSSFGFLKVSSDFFGGKSPTGLLNFSLIFFLVCMYDTIDAGSKHAFCILFWTNKLLGKAQYIQLGARQKKKNIQKNKKKNL